MRRGVGWSVLAMSAMSLMSTTVMAQQEATQTPAPSAAQPSPVAAAPIETPKRITVTAGFDIATAYMFRGIYQEDHGTIIPPYADLGVLLYEGSGALTSVTANVGNWNSLHSGPSGHGGRGNAWYEADYYGSVTFAFGNWKPGALFTSYTSPNDVFKTVHELAGVLAYDDSASRFPLAPKATVAFELHGQADGGANRGTYLELGIRPSITVIDTPKYPLSVAVPVKVGLSLKDYYEGVTGSQRFGFFDTGLIASVPMPGAKISWEVHAGVDLLWLGDSMKALNAGKGFKPVGIFGISVTY